MSVDKRFWKWKRVKRRFFSNIDKRKNGCWLWKGDMYDTGYGQFQLQKHSQSVGAHVASWKIHNGPIPKGMCVLHNCPSGDNKRCVNPDHLWLGTKTDNMADRDAKGRTCKGDDHWTRRYPEKLATGDRNGSRKHPEKLNPPKGEANGMSKLSDYERDVLLPKLAKKGWPHGRIAKRLGISRSRVTAIIGTKRKDGIL